MSHKMNGSALVSTSIPMQRDVLVLRKTIYCLRHQWKFHKHQYLDNFQSNLCLHNSVKVKWHPKKVNQKKLSH